jgi:hypothetical protein
MATPMGAKIAAGVSIALWCLIVAMGRWIRLVSSRVKEINPMLLAFTRWLEHSAIGQGIHNSSWLFPFIETFHLIALGILGGAVLLLDLRLLGFGLRRNPVAEVARDVQPVLNGSR